MEPTDKRLSLAEHFLQIEQPQRTLDILEEAGDLDLDDPRLWALRAMSLYQLERYPDAIRAIEVGLDVDPEDVHLLYLLCKSNAQLGRLAEAERAILGALQLAPETPILLLAYALLTARAGQIDKAERLVNEAARLDPENAGIATLRARLAWVRGNPTEAMQETQLALAADPENLAGRLMLGTILEEKGELQKADHHFRAAARINPSLAPLAEVARASQLQSHWLLLPLWPFQRLGAAQSWIGAIAIIFGLRILKLPTASGLFALFYLFLCVYSWVVPPLLKRWLQRT